MPQSKAQTLNEIHTLLKKRYKPRPERNTRLNVLEAVIYAVCREGTSREQANQSLSRFKDGFFDWNEVRASTVEEVQGALAGLPDAEPRAQRIRKFLRQLFERTYGFTLEALVKKPLKESLKTLSEYEAFTSDFVEAVVIQQSLGGHAIPVDPPAQRALERLGIADRETELSALRSLLERAVPKNRGAEFVDLIEELTHDTCLESEPDCPRCELRKLCPTAHTRKEEAAAAARQAATQAKAAAKDVAQTARTAAKSPAPAPVPAKEPAPPPAPAPVSAPAKGKGKEKDKPPAEAPRSKGHSGGK